MSDSFADFRALQLLQNHPRSLLPLIRTLPPLLPPKNRTNSNPPYRKPDLLALLSSSSSTGRSVSQGGVKVRKVHAFSVWIQHAESAALTRGGGGVGVGGVGIGPGTGGGNRAAAAFSNLFGGSTTPSADGAKNSTSAARLALEKQQELNVERRKKLERK